MVLEALQEGFTANDWVFKAGRLPQDTQSVMTQKKSNRSVLEQIGNDLELLPSFKKHKLTYCGHILRTEGDTVEKDITMGATQGEGRKGRPRRPWEKNSEDWMGWQINAASGLASDRRRCSSCHRPFTEGLHLTWLDLICMYSALSVCSVVYCLPSSFYRPLLPVLNDFILTDV